MDRLDLIRPLGFLQSCARQVSEHVVSAWLKLPEGLVSQAADWVKAANTGLQRAFMHIDTSQTKVNEEALDELDRVLSEQEASKNPQAKNLREGLQKWIQNPQVQGNKTEAAARIVTAFRRSSTSEFDSEPHLIDLSLDLSGLELTQLPSEALRQCTKITHLNLSGNTLKEFDFTGADFPYLKQVDLQGNSIEDKDLNHLVKFSELLRIILPSGRAWLRD